ncbi:hypothetical protein M153_3530006249 [Pseudoloma neurophilia]|uniref:Secreted protein n=1 Tax=Pseudoloma neurophilia TaxID=146866 RepID=A0A0R0LY19_9MICR|nr:hypothetical protein M153_3530006249 [Pseudoloma neurophilia]
MSVLLIRTLMITITFSQAILEIMPIAPDRKEFAFQEHGERKLTSNLLFLVHRYFPLCSNLLDTVKYSSSSSKDLSLNTWFISMR